MIKKSFISIQILLIAIFLQGCGSSYEGANSNSSTTTTFYDGNPSNLYSENEANQETTDFLASRVGCLTNDCEMTPMLNVIEGTERGRVLLDELEDFYDLYLRRQPDANGLSFWAGHVFLGNISMKTAKSYIRNSDEALQLGPKPEVQHIPSPDLQHTTCSAERTWIGRELSSREGYVTRFTNIRGSSYPGKGRYKEDFTYYCAKQRIRCWAGQVRARTVNIVPMARGGNCSALNFIGKIESDYNYIQKLDADLEAIYQTCLQREPTRSEIDQHITSIVESGGTLYEKAQAICGW